jgi:hypothetical protein
VTRCRGDACQIRGCKQRARIKLTVLGGVSLCSRHYKACLDLASGTVADNLLRRKVPDAGA